MLERDNTSQNRDMDFFERLDLLDKSVSEPYVEKVLNDARLYNQLFEEHTPSDEEKGEAIQDLDTQWADLIGASMNLTGRALIPTAEGDIRTVLVDSLAVESNGFGGRTHPQIVGGEQIGEVFRISHYLTTTAAIIVDSGYLSPKDFGVEIDDDTSATEIEQKLANISVRIAADVDAAMVELEGVSQERARSWIESSCPGLVDEIDSLLLNEVEDDNEPIYALKDLYLDGYSAIEDEFTQTCIETYINSVLDFDTSVPYTLELNGYMVSKQEEDKTLYRVENGRTLAYLARVYVVPNPYASEEQGEWQLGVDTQFLNPNQHARGGEFVIPVETISRVQSLRRAYYSGP